MKKNKIEVYFILFFFLTCLFYIVYNFKENRSNVNNVKNGYNFTPGRIVKYWDRSKSDAGSGRLITYEYKVDSITYTRYVYTNFLIHECEDVMSEGCRDKIFWVAYSLGKPSSSLINFKLIYNDKEFPNDLKNFI